MEFKTLFVFLLLALVMVVEASEVQELGWGENTTVGITIGEDELLMVSEPTHRELYGRSRYISYAAMKADNTPCGPAANGRSYYNCQDRGKANPYKRQCTAATHCQRYTD